MTEPEHVVQFLLRGHLLLGVTDSIAADAIRAYYGVAAPDDYANPSEAAGDPAAAIDADFEPNEPESVVVVLRWPAWVHPEMQTVAPDARVAFWGSLWTWQPLDAAENAAVLADFDPLARDYLRERAVRFPNTAASARQLAGARKK